jgi:hypothetical protein
MAGRSLYLDMPIHYTLMEAGGELTGPKNSLPRRGQNSDTKIK